MEKLRRQEEVDAIKNDGKNIKGFHKEIRNTFDKNINDILIKSLDNVVDRYNLEGSETEFLMRTLVNEVKENLKRL